jgi:membrane peptidoglycan carboxypeptidase
MEVNLPELNRRQDTPRIRTRSGRTPRARSQAPGSPRVRQRARRRLLRLAGVLAAGALVVVLAATAYVGSMASSLPSINGLNAASFHGDTLVYDRNGVLLADIGNGGDHRQYVKLDQVSPLVMKATVDIEDRTFWTNSGYDVASIARAALGDVRHSGVQSGASTITQQLAKQLFLGSQQTYTRKLKELLVARELNDTYSKQQILELYLNVNNYGEQQYGVQAASRTYFGKDAKVLDLAQASLLAGLPQAPYDYDPVVHLDAAKARQQQVLAAMLRQGDITEVQAQQAYQEQLAISPPTNDNVRAPQFVSLVEQELKDLGYKVGGQQLVVRTTLDWGKQQLAEGIVRKNLQKNARLDPSGGLNSAAVALDPRTGQILTYVGSAGPGTPGAQYDFVGGGPNGVYVNPGSSVKPYTYAAAIQQGKGTMDTKVFDGPPGYTPPGGQPIYNFVKNKAYGQQPLKVALANSLNISAVKTEEAVGVPQLVDYYRNLGLTPKDANGATTQPDTQFGPSLTLGGYSITLLQHAAALATIADLGTYHKPEAILAVTDANGNPVYQADPNRGARQAMDPGVAFIISSILDDDTNRSLVFGRGTPLHLADRHAAAKTGTTEDFHDGLTVGWTPDLASVFWIGDVTGSGPGHDMTGPNTDGVYVAAPAWHQFMEQALAGVRNDWYTPPADVVRKGDGWYLTQFPTDIPQLAGDTAPPQDQNNMGIPPDPGTGPLPILRNIFGRGNNNPSGGGNNNPGGIFNPGNGNGGGG